MVAFKFFTHSSCFTSCKTAVGHNLLHIVITQRKDTYETNIFYLDVARHAQLQSKLWRL